MFDICHLLNVQKANLSQVILHAEFKKVGYYSDRAPLAGVRAPTKFLLVSVRISKPGYRLQLKQIHRLQTSNHLTGRPQPHQAPNQPNLCKSNIPHPYPPQSNFVTTSFSASSASLGPKVTDLKMFPQTRSYQQSSKPIRQQMTDLTPL